MFVPPASATGCLIIRVYFLHSFKDNEPALAEEEGSSGESHTAENRYIKTTAFLLVS